MSDYARPPDDFDWPATIFLYIVLIILGGGMCFCLKRANRLIPNRFSFPLADRGQVRLEEDEERGLLNSYSDLEDENDAEEIPHYRYEEDELEARLAEDGFGQLQENDDSSKLQGASELEGVSNLNNSPKLGATDNNQPISSK